MKTTRQTPPTIAPRTANKAAPATAAKPAATTQPVAQTPDQAAGPTTLGDQFGGASAPSDLAKVPTGKASKAAGPARLMAMQSPVPRLEALSAVLQDPESVRAALPFIQRTRALLADVSDVSTSAVHAPDYNQMSAEDKARATWSKLQEGTYDLSVESLTAMAEAAKSEAGPDVAAQMLKEKGLHTGCPFSGGVPPEIGKKGILGEGLSSIARVFHLRELQRTFDNPSDFVKPHDKLLHTNGGTVMFVRVPASQDDHGYTGLFADDAPSVGVARYSAGANVDSFVSGLATKTFRDGETSANAVYIHGPEAYAENEPKDPFAKPLLSAVNDPTSTPLKAVNFGFSLSSNPNIRPVDQFATHEADGDKIKNPKAPFMLEVVSVDPEMRFYDDTPRTAEQVAEEAAKPENDYRRKLDEKIDPGTILGEEWGRDSQTGERVHLATYVAVTDFISSRAGDEELHFRHSRGEESVMTQVVQGFVSAYDAAMDLFAPNEE